MERCPVCEHLQEGGECDVCGFRLASKGQELEPFERLAELEPTRLEGDASSPVAQLTELLPTAVEAAGPVSLEDDSSWVERTAAETPPMVAIEPLEVERTGGLSSLSGSDGELLALAVCRYCKTPAVPDEVFCGRCGLKLPQNRERPRESTLGADRRRCRMCGAWSGGGYCSHCGTPLPIEDT